MADKIYVGTGRGILTATRGAQGWRAVAAGLQEQHVTGLIAREGVILAGTTNGVFRGEEEAAQWTAASVGLAVPHVRWMAFHPEQSDLEFAGTEPADIFVSHDGGANWRECREVTILRDANKWNLPYSPEAGCVRGFAFHGARAYAAVEVGGVLRSDNAGETWVLAEGSDGKPDLQGPPEPLIYPDVHSIVVHPSSPDLVYAPTGDGFFRSRDGGKTWRKLYDCYCRAVWVDPANPDHIVLGPADGVQRNGRIEQSRDGGKSWQAASNGLDVPWRRDMVERFVQIEDDLFAVLAGGTLLAAPLKTLAWERILTEVQDITCVTAMVE